MTKDKISNYLNYDIVNWCKNSNYFIFDVNSFKEASEYLIRNCYSGIVDQVIRQIVGILKGSDPAPFLAILL